MIKKYLLELLKQYLSVEITTDVRDDDPNEITVILLLDGETISKSTTTVDGDPVTL